MPTPFATPPHALTPAVAPRTRAARLCSRVTRRCCCRRRHGAAALAASWDVAAVRQAIAARDVPRAVAMLRGGQDEPPPATDDEAALGYEVFDALGKALDLEPEVAETAYDEMSRRGVLKGFGAVRDPAKLPFQRRIASVQRMEEVAGLPISALRPKRSTLLWWQFAGITVVSVTGLSFRGLGLGAWTQPALLGLLAMVALDQVALRGAFFEAAYRTLFPVYEEKVRRHEAAHFFIAYLLGCPVRGYVLSAADAVRLGVPGQAMTLFSDTAVQKELEHGKLTDSSINRFAIVVMAGIAGEALQYGQAEGGASDEAALINLLTSLQPPWKGERILEEALWAALQAILLLRKYRKAYETLVDCMGTHKSLGECIRGIEANLDSVEELPELERLLSEADSQDGVIIAPPVPDADVVYEEHIQEEMERLEILESEIKAREADLEQRENRVRQQEQGSS